MYCICGAKMEKVGCVFDSTAKREIIESYWCSKCGEMIEFYDEELFTGNIPTREQESDEGLDFID